MFKIKTITLSVVLLICAIAGTTFAVNKISDNYGGSIPTISPLMYFGGGTNNARFVSENTKLLIGGTTTSTDSELEVQGNITATSYYGDGSNLTGISSTGSGSNWLVNASGQLTPSTTIDVLLPANATTSHLAVTEMCIGSDCKTSWPTAGVASWDDLTNKPATSTVLNLLDTENRIAVLNSTTTNIGTLTVYSGATLSSATTTDSLSVGKLALGGVYASVYDGSAACAAGAICTGGHTHVGVNETYGTGWNEDMATPEKDDVYDYLHQIDTDDDGDADNLEVTTARTWSGINTYSADLRVTGVLHASSTDFDVLKVNGNATTTGSIDAGTICFAGANCKSAWPELSAGSWDDLTNKPATSTILNLLDTQNRVAMFNSTTTNIDTLTIYTGSTFPANDIVDAEVSDTLTASNLVASGSVVADAEVDDSITINTALQGIFSGDLRVATFNATTTKTDNLTVNTTLSLPANAVTDAMVSNTLTCSDLQAASAVVADSEVVDALTISTSIEGIFTGNIRVNLINATSSLIDTLSVGTVNNFFDADCDAGNYVYGINTDGSLDCRADVSEAGAASSNWDYFDATTIKPTTTVGFFISASSTINSTLRVTGSLTAPGGITGALTGNASTASALSADPSDCAAGTVATAIAANGNLTCSITPLISGGTLTSANVCQYDGTGIDCNLVKDGSGDCASGAVCLGDHTHSSYAPTVNPTFTGLQVTPDLRAAMLNSTTTKVGTLTVFTGSTLSGLSIISDGRLAVINSTTTKSDNLTVNTSLTSAASTLNGLSVIADGRVAMLNSTTSKIDTLIVNTVATLPAGSGPTVDAAGETAIDTTSDQFIFYGGAKRVIPYWGEKCFTMASSTWASVKTNIPLWHPAKAITITDVYCETEGGTSVAITFSDGTNALEAITCDDDGAADDGSIANGTFTADEKFEVDVGAIVGAVDYLNACITYSITAD